MSNGWFVPVDTAFIIVIVRLARLLRQAGWLLNRCVARIKTDTSGLSILSMEIFGFNKLMQPKKKLRIYFTAPPLKESCPDSFSVALTYIEVVMGHDRRDL